MSPTLVGIARDETGAYDTALRTLAGVLAISVMAARRTRPVRP